MHTKKQKSAYTQWQKGHVFLLFKKLLRHHSSLSQFEQFHNCRLSKLSPQHLKCKFNTLVIEVSHAINTSYQYNNTCLVKISIFLILVHVLEYLYHLNYYVHILMSISTFLLFQLIILFNFFFVLLINYLSLVFNSIMFLSYILIVIIRSSF